MRRIRGLLIALAVLAISAGAVLAGRALPQAAADGLARAAEASGKTVPVRPAPALTAEDPEEEEAAPESEEAEDAEDPDNHGAAVSEAAQGETPDGWRNHGAYVSAVARGLAKPGDPAPPEAVANGGRMPKPDKAPNAAKPAKPTP